MHRKAEREYTCKSSDLKFYNDACKLNVSQYSEAKFNGKTIDSFFYCGYIRKGR